MRYDSCQLLCQMVLVAGLNPNKAIAEFYKGTEMVLGTMLGKSATWAEA